MVLVHRGGGKKVCRGCLSPATVGGLLLMYAVDLLISFPKAAKADLGGGGQTDSGGGMED